MTFKPGQSGNPKGRTPGRPNAKTRAVLEKLNGVADALALLGEMVASAEAPLALRVTAATALPPYQYPKAPRLLRKKIDLPAVSTIEEATTCIAHIGSLAARRVGSVSTRPPISSTSKRLSSRPRLAPNSRAAHRCRRVHAREGQSQPWHRGRSSPTPRSRLACGNGAAAR